MDVSPVIGIIGQNELIRSGLGRVLSERGFEIVTSAVSVDEFLGGCSAPELILIDAHNGGSSLSDWVLLKEALPGLRIVLIADAFLAGDVSAAFQSGTVDGYVTNGVSCDVLAGALRLVATGEKVFPSELIGSINVVSAVHRHAQGVHAGSNLSPRETEILSCLVTGDANKVISRRLSISDATVKVHIKAILRKLGVVNRTQAAIWAVS